MSRGARRPMCHALSTILAAALLAACGGGGGGDEGTPVPFATLARTQNSGVASREEVVVRGNAELTQLWGRITVDGAPLPSIDFADFEVLGVFLGSRPNACHAVEISRITQTSARRVVTVRESTPAPGAACSQVTVTPAHLVVAARSTVPVEFVAE